MDDLQPLFPQVISGYASATNSLVIVYFVWSCLSFTRIKISDSITGEEANLILVSDSKLLIDEGSGSSAENRIFIMNAIDYLLGDSELISLRSREVTDRPLLTEADGVDTKKRITWKILNMILPTLLIVLLGIYVLRLNRKKSEKLKGLIWAKK